MKGCHGTNWNFLFKNENYRMTSHLRILNKFIILIPIQDEQYIKIINDGLWENSGKG